MNAKVEEVINQMREEVDGWKILTNLSGDAIASVIEQFLDKLTNTITSADEEAMFTAINNFEEGKRKGFQLSSR